MDSIKRAVNSFGLPRVIILAFFVFLLGMAAFYDLGIPALLGDVIRRWGMFGILVLAMVPAIQSGIGPNFGVSIGIIGGLLGSLISIEMRDMGYFEATANPEVVSVIIALIFAIVFAGIFGFLYGLLLNRVKGSELMVGTYVGFSAVALMSIAWMVLPFNHPGLRWPMGSGVRTTITLQAWYDQTLNRLWKFNIGSVEIPTGLLLTCALFCFLVWLHTRSRSGMMMEAAGSNPKFARFNGVIADHQRILGSILTTVLGGFGIIIYSQGFGFYQLYSAPLMMAFPAVAAVLIGGATPNKITIFNVVFGTIVFQSLLSIAAPVAGVIFPEGNLAEVFRAIISNGVILYALSMIKEGKQG